MWVAVSWEMLGLTAKIVAAHIGKNQVATEALPALIQSVHQALATARAVEATSAAAQIPAVPIERSMLPGVIICLEDAKRLKMFKCHLSTNYNMTPADTCAKWQLPPNYLMVAPSYANRRSTLAKSM